MVKREASQSLGLKTLIRPCQPTVGSNRHFQEGALVNVKITYWPPVTVDREFHVEK